MKIHYNLEQRSEEWHSLRLGKITGSSFHKLLTKGVTRQKYLYQKASEIITKHRSDSESFSSIHIQRGLENESIAQEIYTSLSFNEVQNVGLVVLGEHVACSPDGLVKNDGIIEIKVPDSHNYLENIIKIDQKKDKGIPKEYYMQMQFNMHVTNKSWCDYILFNPKHSKYNNGLYVHRVYKDSDTEKLISESLDTAIKEIKEYIDNYMYIIIKKSKNYE